MRVFSDLWVELGSIREKQNYVVTVREIPRPWLKKKRYFVLLTFQTTLSLGTRLSKKAVISQTKRDITLKDTHEAQVDSDDSWGVRAMRNFPPPSDPSWDLTVCSLSAALLQTHSHVHTQKQVYIQTHTPDRHRLNASQVRAGPEPVLMQSFLGILSSPLFFLFFFFFLHLIALFTFPGWLKAFPQRWLMFWTGRELDYETLWPAQRKG